MALLLPSRARGRVWQRPKGPVPTSPGTMGTPHTHLFFGHLIWHWSENRQASFSMGSQSMDKMTENFGWPWRMAWQSVFWIVSMWADNSLEAVIPALVEPSRGTGSMHPDSSSRELPVWLI